ncbi:Cysteine dioxygenase [Fusarium sp. LHS14.1]|nr:Cysteine dioxygenase [Fusarium sp. LHS14.1]
MADPSQFSDPFWSAPSDNLLYMKASSDFSSSKFPWNLVPARFSRQATSPVVKPVSGAVSNGINYSLASLDQTVGVKFRIGGLGTISVKCDLPEKSLIFTIHPENSETQPTLKLEITKDDCILKKRENDSGAYERIPESLDLNPEVRDRSKYFDKVMFPKGKASALLDAMSSDKTTYWISVDRSNARIRYGQHLTNNSMTFMEILFDPEKADWMDHLASTKVSRDNNPIPPNDIKFNETPVTKDLPPRVMSQDQITLKQIEEMSAMTWANLPDACQKLYHTISGPNITVKSPEFPDLPEAIDRSCRDPAKLCGGILESKKGEFGSIRETYLRITVGDNLANSPGIPYVMEIWPPGHSSPIHQHGDASAIIRVLHGSIDVTWYDALKKNRIPKQIGNQVRLSEGDMTWLGEKQYQIHQLKNNTDKVCITLQCYQFEEHDTIHDEAFHWMDKKLQIKDFIPNSDMAYGLFVQKMKEEWEAENPKPVDCANSIRWVAIVGFCTVACLSYARYGGYLKKLVT